MNGRSMKHLLMWYVWCLQLGGVPQRCDITVAPLSRGQQPLPDALEVHVKGVVQGWKSSSLAQTSTQSWVLQCSSSSRARDFHGLLVDLSAHSLHMVRFLCCRQIVVWFSLGYDAKILLTGPIISLQLTKLDKLLGLLSDVLFLSVVLESLGPLVMLALAHVASLYCIIFIYIVYFSVSSTVVRGESVWSAVLGSSLPVVSLHGSANHPAAWTL